MKLSARNLLKGKVKNIHLGEVNAEVTIELPGGAEIVSVITKASVSSLGLALGGTAFAIIKASNVLIAVD